MLKPRNPTATIEQRVFPIIISTSDGRFGSTITLWYVNLSCGISPPGSISYMSIVIYIQILRLIAITIYVPGKANLILSVFYVKCLLHATGQRIFNLKRLLLVSPLQVKLAITIV